MSKTSFYKSSVGKKVFMAVTGAFLVVFMLVHLGVNMLVLGGADLYNQATHFMGTNPLIQIMQPVLALGFFLHICFGLYLAVKNNAARPEMYKKSDFGKASSWASRYMWLTGLVILGVIGLHLTHFFVPMQITGLPESVADDYTLVVALFKNSLLYTSLYIAWFIVLGVHLAHGFWSMFQSSGQAYHRWLPVLKVFALLYCALIACGFTFVALWCRYAAVI